ncbi:hypothetical protein SAMN05444392_101206 [Seinonella peptonophila]|uniref:Uncharacterized protein n=1 Tax=Seinonella peptonophila TaxID=112248 RepID=A0A1M4SYK2_9BACL|nr:DUF6463 family protein [Seinonella peptonophila]SHE37240.1 hypothetical protein SAMN05444392_101206 [Seinonella peptonophila]
MRIQTQKNSTENSSSLALWAGYILLAIPVIHMFLAVGGSITMWQNMFAEGLWNTISPPWTADDLERQRNFWTQIGSFSIPMFILGASIVWLSSRHQILPSFLGWSLLVYSIIGGFLCPIGGFWLIAIPGFLLIMHSR